MSNAGNGDGAGNPVAPAIEADEESDKILADVDDVDEAPRRGPKLPVYSTSPKLLWIPIIACIIGAGLLSTFLYSVGLAVQFEPVNEDLGFGAVLMNALIFIGIGAVSAFVLIKIVRKKGINALEKVMMVAFLVLGTFIIYLYGEYLLAVIDQYLLGGTLDALWSYAWLAGAFAIAFGLVWLYAAPKYADRQRVHNIVVVIFGVLIGSYLPLVIGTWTALVILMGFSLYDIYSVRHGPIKEMMQQVDPAGSTGDLQGIDLDDITIDIGIGDLAFYSMLTSITLISAEWGGPALAAVMSNPFLYFIPFAAAVVGVLIGAWISFELVKKNKILPGLPMSIFIGIGLYSLAIGLCLLFI
jgi:hypothetical protein